MKSIPSQKYWKTSLCYNSTKHFIQKSSGSSESSCCTNGKTTYKTVFDDMPMIEHRSATDFQHIHHSEHSCADEMYTRNI